MNKKIMLSGGVVLALVTGCAVLTVDVDVYTGPLANTVEVQSEQVISLVMGVRPLLVQLRDHLEVAGRPNNPLEHGSPRLALRGASLQEELVRFRTNDFYWAGFFAPSSGRKQNLKNDLAIRVNEVLGLYEDRAPWDIAPLLDRGAEALQDYLDAYAIFHPADPRHDERLWQEMKRGMKPDGAHAGLRRAYRELLIPNPVDATRTRRVSKRLEVFVETELAKEFSGAKGANALFAHLLGSGGVANHAELLFGSEASAAKKLFEQRVKDLAQAFLKAREAMRELLLVSLDGHALAAETGPGSIKFESISVRQSILQAGAELIAACIQPAILNKQAADRVGINSPAARLGAKLGPGGSSRWTRLDYAAAAKTITHALFQDGAALTQSLGLLDAVLAESRDIEFRFGLARGPTADEAEILQSEDLRRSLRDLEGTINSAFSGGRLQPGMETLIENYLESARDHPSFDSRSNSKEFTLLLDSLVAFAQKVVTLGNTARLLNSSRDTEVNQYIAVLQYVGNSILVHVDELKNRAIHARQLKEQAPITATALREAGFTNAVFAKNRPLGTLDAKDLLAHLLEILRAQHVNAILTNPSPVVAELSGATYPTNFPASTLGVTNVTVLFTNASLTASGANLSLPNSSLVTFDAKLSAAAANLHTTNASLTASEASLLATNSSLTITNPVVAFTNATLTVPLGRVAATQASLAASNVTLTAQAKVEVTNAVLSATNAEVKAEDLSLHLPGIRVSATNRVTIQVSDKFLRAIERVTEMKNGKVYLRPASAYLRSSYPATTLNLNESVGWNNQLKRQALRSLPLIGELLEAGSSARLKELRELDKQSWQNINRIRVAGAGNANYVLAKDDIGNWYVKSYAANPSNIVKTARNLAMFSAGDAFGRRLSILGAGGNGSLATNSPFNAQFEKASVNYLGQTTNTWNSLTNRLLGDTFTNQLAAAWSQAGLAGSNLITLTATAFAKTASGTYVKAVNASQARITKSADKERAHVIDAETVNVLHSVKRYHTTVRPNLKLDLAPDTQNAQRAFTDTVRDFLDAVIAERSRALQRFETAIEVIQGAAGP